MLQMIVTDLDNTLLRSEKTISEYTINVLKWCQARGIKVVFATARSAQAASRYLAMFAPDVFIGYGGALAAAGEQVISRIDISAEMSAQLIRDCLAMPGIRSIHAVNEVAAHTSNPGDLEIADSSHYRYYDFLRDSPHAYLKISAIADNQAAVEQIAAHYPVLDMLRYTGEDLYRFANRDAVKWNALVAVARHYGVSTDSLVAFGDDVNDLEMLQKCGTGVAVENAIDQVKAVADDNCGSNDEDGVARWLERHVLQA